MREHLDGGDALADKEISDHASVEILLKELEGRDAGDADFDRLVWKKRACPWTSPAARMVDRSPITRWTASVHGSSSLTSAGKPASSAGGIQVGSRCPPSTSPPEAEFSSQGAQLDAVVRRRCGPAAHRGAGEQHSSPAGSGPVSDRGAHPTLRDADHLGGHHPLTRLLPRKGATPSWLRKQAPADT